MKTLEQIIAEEREHRHENGIFGIKACKESILSAIETNKILNKKYDANNPTSLYCFLEQYVKRAQTDTFFNRAMVLACWELINETNK